MPKLNCIRSARDDAAALEGYCSEFGVKEGTVLYSGGLDVPNLKHKLEQKGLPTTGTKLLLLKRLLINGEPSGAWLSEYPRVWALTVAGLKQELSLQGLSAYVNGQKPVMCLRLVDALTSSMEEAVAPASQIWVSAPSGKSVQSGGGCSSVLVTSLYDKAVAGDFVGCCNDFLENPQSAREGGTAGRAAMHGACEGGHLELAQTLKETMGCGPDTTRPDDHGVTPVWVAAFKGHARVLKWLCAEDGVRQGADSRVGQESEQGGQGAHSRVGGGGNAKADVWRGDGCSIKPLHAASCGLQKRGQFLDPAHLEALEFLVLLGAAHPLGAASGAAGAGAETLLPFSSSSSSASSAASSTPSSSSSSSLSTSSPSSIVAATAVLLKAGVHVPSLRLGLKGRLEARLAAREAFVGTFLAALTLLRAPRTSDTSGSTTSGSTSGSTTSGSTTSGSTTSGSTSSTSGSGSSTSGSTKAARRYAAAASLLAEEEGGCLLRSLCRLDTKDRVVKLVAEFSGVLKGSELRHAREAAAALASLVSEDNCIAIATAARAAHTSRPAHKNKRCKGCGESGDQEKHKWADGWVGVFFAGLCEPCYMAKLGIAMG